MRVAIIKTGALGDVVRTTSIVQGLYRSFAHAEITWVTSGAGVELVRSTPRIAHVFDIADDVDSAWRTHRYDWVISLDDEWESCRLASSLTSARLSGAYLSTNGMRHYTRDTDEWFGMGILRPVQDGGLQRANELKRINRRSHPEILYRMLGLPLPVERPTLSLPAEASSAAEQYWRLSGLCGRTVVGLNTGAGGRWEFKKWGEGQTATLAARVSDELEASVLLFGGPEEGERNQRISAAAKRPGRVLVPPATESVLAFAARISRCDLLITSDSLALHLGLAVSTPIISFFGPTSDHEICLFGSGEKIVTPLSCRCCYRKTCDVRPHCMASIEVGAIFDATRRMMRLNHRDAGNQPSGRPPSPTEVGGRAVPAPAK